MVRESTGFITRERCGEWWQPYCFTCHNLSLNLRFLSGPPTLFVSLLVTTPLFGMDSVEVVAIALRWRHNGHDSISNHQPHDCLLKRLFADQMPSNAENGSIWWRHHAYDNYALIMCVLVIVFRNPLLLTWLTYSANMDKLLHPFIICGINLLVHSQVWEWIEISSNTLLDMWLLIHAGVKVKTRKLKGSRHT